MYWGKIFGFGTGALHRVPLQVKGGSETGLAVLTPFGYPIHGLSKILRLTPNIVWPFTTLGAFRHP